MIGSAHSPPLPVTSAPRDNRFRPHDDIVRVAHDDHVAGGFPLSPAFGPEVEAVVQVDIRKQRRDDRPLPGSPFTDSHDLIFENARLQPFLDQADDAAVADPVFNEPDQPFLADHIEEGAYSVNCWYGPNPIAPRIIAVDVAFCPNASRVRRQPR